MTTPHFPKTGTGKKQDTEAGFIKHLITLLKCPSPLHAEWQFLRGHYFSSSLDAQLDSIYMKPLTALPEILIPVMPVPTVDQADSGITELNI